MEGKDETKPTTVEAEEAKEEGEFVLDLNAPLKELSADEEDTLNAFMNKVMKACDNDKSIPGFVGDQVGEWLKELDEKKPQEDKNWLN